MIKRIKREDLETVYPYANLLNLAEDSYLYDDESDRFVTPNIYKQPVDLNDYNFKTVSREQMMSLIPETRLPDDTSSYDSLRDLIKACDFEGFEFKYDSKKNAFAVIKNTGECIFYNNPYNSKYLVNNVETPLSALTSRRFVTPLLDLDTFTFETMSKAEFLALLTDEENTEKYKKFIDIAKECNKETHIFEFDSNRHIYCVKKADNRLFAGEEIDGSCRYHEGRLVSATLSRLINDFIK